MAEISINEYVRTKKKGIFKVLSIRKTPYGYYCGTVDNDNIRTFTIGKGGNAEIKNDIVKHSKNIIDLIEVGDYVNGKKVIEVDDCKGAMREVYVEGQNPEKDCGLYFEQIETIVTKEQFKSIEYRMED